MAVKSKPTQRFIPIKEIRDGVVIMKDGSMRMVLMVSSSNFALKSADEQTAILLQFQTLLNTLDFTTQIFIQSRRLDIRPYLALLRRRLKEQLSDLMKIQIQEYIEFIRGFTEASNIMTKTFFVIVPYSGTGLSVGSSSSNPFSALFGRKSKEQVAAKETRRLEAFEEARSQLEQRTNVVMQGLGRTGIRGVVLGTEELTELYYKFFNPGETANPTKTKK